MSLERGENKSIRIVLDHVAREKKQKAEMREVTMIAPGRVQRVKRAVGEKLTVPLDIAESLVSGGLAVFGTPLKSPVDRQAPPGVTRSPRRSRRGFL